MCANFQCPRTVPPNLPRYGTQTPKSGGTIASFALDVYPAGRPTLRPITEIECHPGILAYCAAASKCVPRHGKFRHNVTLRVTSPVL